ncbi:DUF2726 domain-containing protein [Myxococcus llanfairpwllgwyngyllgogerychwyrndrobwllllantysiliogogogochensis]|nr:DUF2726 domain-containing protein [Myxococcus llanfairpwllgwyngyllgogerychwyrndrobwllllantysiliogogogochensis]
MARKKRLFANANEATGHRQLTEWARANGFVISSQCSLSQVLDVDALTGAERNYAFMASFDLVVARSGDGEILFAAEVDGESHKSAAAQRKDRLKNMICRKLNMPLVRVGPTALSTKLDGFASALTWIATLFPHADAIADAYSSGAIPSDEIVFPTDIGVDFVGGKLHFPLDPVVSAYNRMHQYVADGHVLRFPATFNANYAGYSAGGTVTFALAFVETGTLVGWGGCLTGNDLPIPEHDVSTTLAVVDLEQQILQYIGGIRTPLAPPAVVARMRRAQWAKGWSFDEGGGVHPVIKFTNEGKR